MVPPRIDHEGDTRIARASSDSYGSPEVRSGARPRCRGSSSNRRSRRPNPNSLESRDNRRPGKWAAHKQEARAGQSQPKSELGLARARTWLRKWLIRRLRTTRYGGRKACACVLLPIFLRGPGTALVDCGCVDASAELYKDAKQRVRVGYPTPAGQNILALGQKKIFYASSMSYV